MKLETFYEIDSAIAVITKLETLVSRAEKSEKITLCIGETERGIFDLTSYSEGAHKDLDLRESIQKKLYKVITLALIDALADCRIKVKELGIEDFE